MQKFARSSRGLAPRAPNWIGAWEFAVPSAIKPHLWPDGKHKSWETVDAVDRQAIVLLLKKNVPTEQILKSYPHVSVGTLAAVKAALKRK